MRQNIKIFIACHKECEVIKNAFFIPIHVGAALSNKNLDMLRDDVGENISHKNATYCELTAQYWVWKNIDADYYGIMHYRRYFSFNKKTINIAGNIEQICFPEVNGRHCNDFQFNEEAIENLVEQYDIITPKLADISTALEWQDKNGNAGVYIQYKNSKNHHIKDYDFCCECIRKKYPEYIAAMEKYNTSVHPYFYNMFIMKKEYFHQYSSWLFSILEAYEKEHDNTNYNMQEYRVIGYLAERLFGIWITHMQSKCPQLKIHHAQTSIIQNTNKLKLQPAFQEKNKAICLLADDRNTPFAGVVIASIVANAKLDNNYDILLLSNGIQEQNRELLLRSIQNVKNISLRFIDIDSALKEDLYNKPSIDISYYAKLCIPHILSNYEKAVYIDCDTIVNRDIADLYDIDISSYYLAAVRDTVHAGLIKQKAFGTEENVKESLGLTDVYSYFNAGVLLLNIQKLNALFSNKQLINLALLRKWDCHEQDILNYLCNKHVLLLEQNWNVIVHSYNTRSETVEYDAPKWLYKEYLSARENPYILQYANRQMPCFVDNVDLQEYFWKYAKNSIFYENILSYKIEEKACLSTTSTTKTNKYKNLLKKGFISLKKYGIIATLKKIKRKIYPKFARKKSIQNISNTSNISTILLQTFNRHCSQFNLKYWFIYTSLMENKYKNIQDLQEVLFEIALLREDLEKLFGSNNALLCCKKEYAQDGIEYFAYLREVPEFKIKLYPYDKSCKNTIEEAWEDRQQQRIQNLALLQKDFASNTTLLNSMLQESKHTSNLDTENFVVLGWEVPLSVYTSAIALDELYPLQKISTQNLSFYMPFATEKIKKRLYLNVQDVQQFATCKLEKNRVKEIKSILKKIKKGS